MYIYIENGRGARTPKTLKASCKINLWIQLFNKASMGLCKKVLFHVPSLKQCRTGSHDLWVFLAPESSPFWDQLESRGRQSHRLGSGKARDKLWSTPLGPRNHDGKWEVEITIVKHFNQEFNTDQSQTDFCKQKHREKAYPKSCIMFSQDSVVLKFQYIGGLIFAV